jgi:hypothetical protein
MLNDLGRFQNVQQKRKPWKRPPDIASALISPKRYEKSRIKNSVREPSVHGNIRGHNAPVPNGSHSRAREPRMN